MRGALRIAGLALSTTLGLLAGGCSGDQAEIRRPNVVLFTVDTLRADHLGAYGGTAARTPSMDRLAAGGVLFDNAACPMPVTRPSVFSLLTSRYPRQHGVMENALELPASVPTVAESFQAAGYRTAASVGVVLLAPASGVGRGFDDFFHPRGRRELPGREVVEPAAAWLAARAAAGEPFFLWVHLYDPHMPYAPPPEHRPPPQRVDGEGEGPAADGSELHAISWHSLGELAAARGGDLGPAALERALALYAGEVEAADAALGVLLGALERAGAEEETVLAFTADHGECFGHGYYFRHSDCLYDGAARVPLILHAPGPLQRARREGAPHEAGSRVARQVELLDVAPTLLELAGLEVPPGFVGRSLLAGGEPGAPGAAAEPEGGERAALVEHPLYARLPAQRHQGLWSVVASVAGEPVHQDPSAGDLYALRTRRWKYLVGDGGEKLYDLAADPGESRDVLRRHPRQVLALRRRLRRRLEAYPLTLLEPGRVDPQLLSTLRALGYL